MNENVDILEIAGRTYVIVGTAHVSEASVALAEATIREHAPDAVAIELCQPRFEALQDPERWKKTDIMTVIKSGKIFLLLAQLMLASFQRKLGKELKVTPGQEMMHSAAIAKSLGIPVVMADREVKITLKRTWAALSWWQKSKLMFMGPVKLFSSEKIELAEIEALKKQDALESALHELSQAFPGVKEALIDERDKYLARKIFDSSGKKVVAIVGAGHVPGIKRYLGTDIDLAPLEIVPLPSKLGGIMGWGLLAVFIALLVYGFFEAGAKASMAMATSWILINGCFAAFGSLLALGHPLSILTAFVSAPITTLHPLLASGWCAGLVEAYVRKPTVADLEHILDDMESVRGLFSNRVTKIILVTAFTNLFGMLGAFVALGKLASFAKSLH